MKRRILLLVVSGLMALSLVMAACAPAATPTTTTTPATSTAPTTPTTTTATSTPTPEPAQKESVNPTGEVPKYGGQLNIVLATDITSFDPAVNTGQTVANLLDIVNEPLWEGDWARGPAGGYGTNEISYATDNDLWSIKTGIIAQSTNWTLDFGTNTGTVVYEIRQGMHYGLNSASPASQLVNGAVLTADDVIFNMKRMISDVNAYVNKSQPEMKTANITKTGPWEITVKVPLTALLTTITRFGQGKIEAPRYYRNTATSGMRTMWSAPARLYLPIISPLAR